MRRRGLTAAWGASGLAQRSGHAQRSGLVTLSVFTASLVTATVDAPALAQGPPDYGLDFVTVGSPGNRGTLPSERPNAVDPDVPYGAVGYEYRITRTEVLTEQWVEFCNAYRPYWTGSPIDGRFTGRYILPDAQGVYRADPGTSWYPIDPSWEMAARYVNWLCNDKRPERWAFETGAYDTSTFTTNPDGSANDQIMHSPGARFWLPTIDEAIKAFYYDPNRHGPGQEGYWRYPNRSDSPLIIGPPGAGQTNASLADLGPGFDRSAGRYPGVTTPWGVLDASGGEAEFTETAVTTFDRQRVVVGSDLYTSNGFVPLYDPVDGIWGRATRLSTRGFRVVGVVPGSLNNQAQPPAIG